MGDGITGERGPTGDHGQQGDLGDPGVEGPRGHMGIIGERGPSGLRGERGPTGDHGQRGENGEPGLNGLPGQIGVDGPRGLQGISGPPCLLVNNAAQTASKKAYTLNALTKLLISIIILSAFTGTFIERNDKNDRINKLNNTLIDYQERSESQRSVLLSEIERLKADQDDLLMQIDDLNKDQTEERLVDDCVSLYQDDINSGIALSQVAIADALYGFVQVPSLTETPDPVVEAFENEKIAAALLSANEPLRVAVQALVDYRLIIPPPGQCPHPLSGE